MGIGAGVAFWEYSSFQYEGERMLGQTETKTKVLEYEIPKGTGKKEILLRQCQEQEHTLIEDKKAPENVIQYEVTYNPEYIEPRLYFSDGVEGYKGELYLSGNNMKGECEFLLENKDQILNDLKNKKIATYKYERITKVKIRINPKTMKKVENEEFYY